MDEERGIYIGDRRSGVRLTRVGPANELGQPTLIEVQAGPFAGAVHDATVYYGRFRSEVARLYETLSGKATLGSHEGFYLVMTASRTGVVAVEVEIIGQPVPLIRLTFEFTIDQSYLPPIIKQLASEFPEPHRVL